jgi:hypothetical protein
LFFLAGTVLGSRRLIDVVLWMDVPVLRGSFGGLGMCLVLWFFFAYMMRAGRQPLIDVTDGRTDMRRLLYGSIKWMIRACVVPTVVLFGQQVWYLMHILGSLKQRPQAAALEFSVLQVGHGTIPSLREIPEFFSFGSFDFE